MAHVRKQLRDAAKALLSAAPTNWDSQAVFAQRHTLNREVGTYLLVYISGSEISDEYSEDGTDLERFVNLHVRGRLRLTEDERQLDNEDAMLAEIESTLTDTALKTQLGHDNIVMDLIDEDVRDLEEEFEKSYAEVALDWRVQLFTHKGDPETLR